MWYVIFFPPTVGVLLSNIYLREAFVQEKCSFFNIVQKAVDPLSFEHYVMNFSEGILTKVRRLTSIATIIDKITCKSMVKMLNLD